MGEPLGEVRQPINYTENAICFLKLKKEQAGGKKFGIATDYFLYLLELGRNGNLVKALNGRLLQPTDKFSVMLEGVKELDSNSFFPNHMVKFRDEDMKGIEVHYTNPRFGGVGIDNPSAFQKSYEDICNFYKYFIDSVSIAYISKYGDKKGKKKFNQAFNQLANRTKKDVIKKIEERLSYVKIC